MIVAIYARKSTEQNGVADETKSVTRQVEHAKAYAERKGWIVTDEHIYSDDGISGAEFAKRPGFLRLMNALKPRPPFQVLIMSEESRLGREAIEVAFALKRLTQAGVRIFLYLEDRERTIDSPTDKLLLSVTAFTDEMERERARQRTYDAMVRKAKAGHVTGGITFGYRNARQPDGSVHRVIDEGEAATVLKIFELYAGGLGLRTIAHQLNDAGALAPLPRRTGRPRGWAPSSVREILYRSLYRGQIEWGRKQKRDRWGQKKYLDRPKGEWIRLEAPELRIVNDVLWKATHDRLDGARASYLRATSGKLWGRPSSGIESKYLLTGFCVCAMCGGSLSVRTRDYHRHRIPVYGCTSYHLRGRSVCQNALELPMVATNDAVIGGLEQELLHPDAITIGLTQAITTLTAPGDEDVQLQVRAELADVEARIARLSQAIQIGGPLEPLVADLKGLTMRREHLLVRLNGHDRPVGVADLRVLEAELRGYIGEWTELLRRHAQQARQMLRKLIDGRITVHPRDGEAARSPYRGVARSKGDGDPGGIRTRDLDLERVAS
jgi:site-specific DNA recombinase